METERSRRTSDATFWRFLSSCCFVFLFFVILLSAESGFMMLDADPFSHVATGDWIREHHAIPERDPFSFTAGTYRWVNPSWAWDCLFSLIHSRLGWHGALAVNVLLIALVFTVLYVACAHLCRDGWAAFLTVFAASFLCIPFLRPLEFTQLFMALWILVLGGVIREKASSFWLALLPLSMACWVNMHGGFAAGFTILGAYGVEALLRRNARQLRILIVTGVASLAALWVSPYGVLSPFEALRPQFSSFEKHYIIEWMPLTTSALNLMLGFYFVLFIALVRQRPAAIRPAEYWLAWIWLLLGFISHRHLAIFALVSAPVFACRLAEIMASRATATAASRPQLMVFFEDWPAAALAMLAALAVCLWLPFSGPSFRFAGEASAKPLLTQEIAFLKEHYPHVRLLNGGVQLGSRLLYEAKGEIPVFFDGRTHSAYPESVLNDYTLFLTAAPDWEKILDRYSIDGVIANDPATLDRFAHRSGWTKVFAGPGASIFMRGARGAADEPL